MQEIFKTLLLSENFVPHGHCYLWNPGLVWLHVLSDGLTGLAYYSIPLMLIYLANKRYDLPFKRIFFLFGAFIVTCGTTHLLEVWTLWHPTYLLSGGVKALTALVSIYTALELYPLIPQILAVPSAAQLEAANQKLAAEIVEKQQAEATLKQREAHFRSLFEGISLGIEIIDLAGRTIAINPALQKMLGYGEKELTTFDFTENIASINLPNEAENSESIPPEKRYLLRNRQTLIDSESYQKEKRYLCKNGQMIWCQVHAYLVRDDQGRPQFYIRMVEDITERKQAVMELQQYQSRLEDLIGERTALLTQVNQQLSWEASHDALTELINRQEFRKRLEEGLATTKTQNQQHAMCYLDLDKFKIVNDTCGHAAGDELLRQVTNLLQKQVRQSDVLARLGGDEFGLLLHNCSIKQGQAVAQSLLDSIREFRFIWNNQPFIIGVSIGLVTINAETKSIESVMNMADAACYQAKNNGRNCIYTYEPNKVETAQTTLAEQWLNKINQAISAKKTDKLANNQFRLYSQQIFPLNSQQPQREFREILLRLVDENGEIIPPMAFLPAAERYDLITTIDRWVIDTVFGILHQQSQEEQSRYLYAINLSASSVKDERLIDFLKAQLDTYQILPESICFEISETVVISQLNFATNLIESLKYWGFKVALDDFGIGVSSLNCLKQIPVDYWKINGNLVQQVKDDLVACEMINMINRIAHILDIKTIAKFVTDNSILLKVKEMGVDEAQGYGIAAPRPLVVNSQLIYEIIGMEE
ncbi:EAL domain-containing protein [Phormidium sp. LEGE 05292]|uniref:bifunctional diguanylate cyclase/phosphodiesterase n=1 Tax=[Phormidium] sp. LEGE 05292 TaxID=767427 RepID=UPI0018800593|nr:EAL domain-containing protein [Phormidium sp. LEGE 05292]MBE9226382.1 EAL domain-containing protein [Phormidium sp. LEGE 05292]